MGGPAAALRDTPAAGGPEASLREAVPAAPHGAAAPAPAPSRDPVPTLRAVGLGVAAQQAGRPEAAGREPGRPPCPLRTRRSDRRSSPRRPRSSACQSCQAACPPEAWSLAAVQAAGGLVISDRPKIGSDHVRLC